MSFWPERRGDHHRLQRHLQARLAAPLRTRASNPHYQVIYNIVDDLKAAAEGMLQPDLRERDHRSREVRKVFRVTKVARSRVAISPMHSCSVKHSFA